MNVSDAREPAKTLLLLAPPGRKGFFARLGNAIRATSRRAGSGPAPVPQTPAALLARLVPESDDAAVLGHAATLLAAYRAGAQAERESFFQALRELGPDRDAVRRVALAFVRDPSDERLVDLQRVADPPRQEVLRRLNSAPGGTAALVSMRADLLRLLPSDGRLGLLDADFLHLFASWFNRGFLEMRPVNWRTPATVLERLIRYESVHAIQGWDDLRGRLDPPDRRCFAFFHPALPDEPLIFVEVALTSSMPARIAELLTAERDVLDPARATTAVFYSINNCLDGLRGVSFGNLLIKQAVGALRSELPQLKQFCTLSPVPGFRRWLERADPRLASTAAEATRAADAAEEAGPAVRRRLAKYLLDERDEAGRLLDPVARFHLGNGARLERINTDADRSDKAQRQSFGVMVNYVYGPGEIESNRVAVERGERPAAGRDVLRELDR